MKPSKKRIQTIFFAAILIVVAGEIFARYYLGLGTPPLSITDSQIEYLFKPGQDVVRFGNKFATNQYGMRSDAFTTKNEGRDFRVMVFGDSVMNGGNLTDQNDLATSILQKSLGEITVKEVVVGNISAGSWGPGNWLGYAQKYGFFDAGVVVLIISSHDYADNPTFEPLNPNTHPTETPFLALTEGLTRYVPRYFPHFLSRKTRKTEQPTEPPVGEVTKASEDLKGFLTFAKENSDYVLVFQHWERGEIVTGKAGPGNERIRRLCESLEISPISLAPYFKNAISNGVEPYRDNIHPNRMGQRLIAKAILEHISGSVMHVNGD